MPLPRIRPARWLLALGLTGMLLLVAGNVRNLFDHLDDWSAVRSDLRQVFAVLIVVGAFWLISEHDRAKVEAHQAEIALAIARGLDSRNADTGPIPRMRIVGSAVVAAQPVPTYADGYADGLAAPRPRPTLVRPQS